MGGGLINVIRRAMSGGASDVPRVYGMGLTENCDFEKTAELFSQIQV